MIGAGQGENPGVTLVDEMTGEVLGAGHIEETIVERVIDAATGRLREVGMENAGRAKLVSSRGQGVENEM